MRLYEFAPTPDRDNEPNGPDYIEQLANRWWNAADPAKQTRIATVLKSLGYAIRQTDDELEDEVELTDIKSGHKYYLSADNFDPDLFEISDQRLQDYLHRAGAKVDSRMNRMAQARERLNKGYEIYHADRPAGSNQIIDRFEANTPVEARRYYEKFIQNYESDVDFDLRLRRSTGIMEYVEQLPSLINKTADVDGIKVSINTNAKNATAYASAGGKRLGYAEFDRDGNTLVPYDLAVDDRYRGQGIAAIIYDYVKSLGFTIRASEDQTPDGKYFWRKNRGRKRVWESVQAYHGTFQPTLTKFNALSHFGTLQAAEDRLKEKARREKIKTPGRVYEVVLDIKNPFVAKDFAGVHSPTHFAFDLKNKGLISQAELQAINKHIGTPKQAELLIKKLRELGFDSIAYKNKYEDKGSTSYVILDPTQVVSVRPVEQKETVAEISRLPKSELGDWGKKGTLADPEQQPKKKPLPGGSKFSYAVDRTGKGDIEIMIFDGKTLAAEMDLFDTQDFMKTWRVDTVVVDPDYRGQGLGKALYGIALSILKLTLEAGETQTRHGQQMWLMLNSIPGVEVVGYNMEPTDEYRHKPGDQVVDQNDRWTRYTFPVTSGKVSMRSGRRGTGIYTSQASMIARWTGQ